MQYNTKIKHMMTKLFNATILLVACIFALFFTFKRSSNTLDLSKHRKDGWFGAGKYENDSTEIRPFSVNYSELDLQDLMTRLKNARYADHIVGTRFNYGFSSVYLKQVVQYWLTKYDWRKEEAKLNAFDQFQTQIEGLNIHFYRVRPKESSNVKILLPLLLIHGWPCSGAEFIKMLDSLTKSDKNGLAFEVIAPSIPGFGYSEAPAKKGFDIPATARIFVKLMLRLGHERFLVHGGDFGNGIARFISVIYADNVIGLHLLGNSEAIMVNSFSQAAKMLFAAYFPKLFFPIETADRDYRKLFPLWDKLTKLLSESGYMHIQTTKPDTVGAALVDSPTGLAAYMLALFSTHTNHANGDKSDGGLTEKFTLDELLTNVMIYWSSGSIASSMRYYKENVHVDTNVASQTITVPAGTVDYEHEFVRTPRQLMEHAYVNLLQYSDFPRGGHYLALEEPQLLCEDIRALTWKIIEQENKNL